MLFNSFEFLLVFLPLTLAGFYLLGRVRALYAAAWLAVMSLVFYAYLIPTYLALLLVSITLNFQVGKLISKAGRDHQAAPRRRLMFIGVACNLAALAYFKYANFFLNTLDALTGLQWSIAQIALPLGISFFTFTQIAFLVDTSRGEASEPNFVHYLLFVTYFPHLIAGPILHHGEMMPQFKLPQTYRLDAGNVAVGLSIFAVGLFKKVVLADGVAVYVAPAFDAAAAGSAVDFYTAWTGALCYTLQLYFDFSGYSDMAIGLSRLFGITLPINFNSPYKATNIIDFWRRWHMTLSRFLRDYLYIALGGSRRGLARRMANVMITMLLGGLWHGAGWTFVVWGGLHGVFLAVNHLWHAARSRSGARSGPATFGGSLLGGGLTFLCVVLAWVFFRAANLDAALRLIEAMLSVPAAAPARLATITLPFELLNVLHWRLPPLLHVVGVDFGIFKIHPMTWIVVLLSVAWLMPNTQELFRHFKPALGIEARPSIKSKLDFAWRPSMRTAALTAVLTLLSLINMNRVSEFLYFQF